MYRLYHNLLLLSIVFLHFFIFFAFLLRRICVEYTFLILWTPSTSKLYTVTGASRISCCTCSTMTYSPFSSCSPTLLRYPERMCRRCDNFLAIYFEVHKLACLSDKCLYHLANLKIFINFIRRFSFFYI